MTLAGLGVPNHLVCQAPIAGGDSRVDCSTCRQAFSSPEQIRLLHCCRRKKRAARCRRAISPQLVGGAGCLREQSRLCVLPNEAGAPNDWRAIRKVWPLTTALYRSHPRRISEHTLVTNIREAQSSDQEFLESMFVEAALWNPVTPRQSFASLLRMPEFRRYFIEWGRPSDVALIASVQERLVGAAWYRFFRSDQPGYGFVDESIPELGIAVVSGWRGQSIGAHLLRELLATAKSRGCVGLSLSVSAANPARRLYERCGFSKIGNDVGATLTMLARFP
jgi:GNAT superfamily N-acetyltransferase